MAQHPIYKLFVFTVFGPKVQIGTYMFLNYSKMLRVQKQLKSAFFRLLQIVL